MTWVNAILGIPKNKGLADFIIKHIAENNEIYGDDAIYIDGKNVLDNKKYQFYRLSVHVSTIQDLASKLKDFYGKFVWVQVYE